ncbi:hypothetical protein C4D60_Mb09t03350 [Musa balbisiana]|uniref:Uncharacterized protein n=1 Tax=Musa balbisiana TaxID=52838 RepID=A0A4S8IDP1_MUSBA|nr:hypothetical protein C4D60_Mb09t03350 [Musa balbisiana]
MHRLPGLGSYRGHFTLLVNTLDRMSSSQSIRNNYLNDAMSSGKQNDGHRHHHVIGIAEGKASQRKGNHPKPLPRSSWKCSS